MIMSFSSAAVKHRHPRKERVKSCVYNEYTEEDKSKGEEQKDTGGLLRAGH